MLEQRLLEKIFLWAFKLNKTVFMLSPKYLLYEENSFWLNEKHSVKILMIVRKEKLSEFTIMVKLMCLGRKLSNQLLPKECENWICILFFMKEKSLPTVYLFRFLSYWFDTILVRACYVIGESANSNSQLVDGYLWHLCLRLYFIGSWFPRIWYLWVLEN